MKKIAFVLFFLFSLCMPVYAANFVEITRDDNYLVYIDVDSIASRTSYNHEYVVAWSKWIPRGDEAKELSKEYKKPVNHEMSFIALNKNIKQIQTLSRHLYDKKGNIINGGSWPFQTSNYKEVIPDTYGETFYDFIMFYYNKNK